MITLLGAYDSRASDLHSASTIRLTAFFHTFRSSSVAVVDLTRFVVHRTFSNRRAVEGSGSWLTEAKRRSVLNVLHLPPTSPHLHAPTSLQPIHHASIRCFCLRSRRSGPRPDYEYNDTYAMAHHADALKAKGNDLFKLGDFAGAEEQYTQAIQRYSKNPLIFTNRAFARIKLQRWDGVVDDCMHSIELTGSEQNFKAYFYLGPLPRFPIPLYELILT